MKILFPFFFFFFWFVDEGFIEITFDPATAKPDDELFPASVFQTTAEPSTSRLHQTTGMNG